MIMMSVRSVQGNLRLSRHKMEKVNIGAIAKGTAEVVELKSPRTVMTNLRILLAVPAQGQSKSIQRVNADPRKEEEAR